jgi:hypothetical protein
MTAKTAAKAASTAKRRPKVEPTPHASTYVNPGELDWKPSPFPGIQIKLPYEDKAKGELTCLLKWAPGASLPMHRQLGASPKFANAFFAFGNSHFSMSAGPVMGKVIAEIVAGRKPDIDLAPFAPTRFA